MSITCNKFSFSYYLPPLRWYFPFTPSYARIFCPLIQTGGKPLPQNLMCSQGTQRFYPYRNRGRAKENKNYKAEVPKLSSETICIIHHNSKFFNIFRILHYQFTHIFCSAFYACVFDMYISFKIICKIYT